MVSVIVIVGTRLRNGAHAPEPAGDPEAAVVVVVNCLLEGHISQNRSISSLSGTKPNTRATRPCSPLWMGMMASPVFPDWFGPQIACPMEFRIMFGKMKRPLGKVGVSCILTLHDRPVVPSSFLLTQMTPFAPLSQRLNRLVLVLQLVQLLVTLMHILVTHVLVIAIDV